jgi:membrane protease subunit HflK
VVGANVMDNILTSSAAEQVAVPATPTTTAAPVAAAQAAVNQASAAAQARDTLQQQTREILQATLDSYDSGLAVTDVSFQNVSPPQEVKEAFDDVNAAREDKQGTENKARAYASQKIPEARGEAARILAAAQAYSAERVARANGDTARFDLILKEYRAAPEVTRRRLWLETMEDVMSNTPKVLDGTNGRNMIYLPLDRTAVRDLPGVGTVAPAADDTGKEKQ